MNGQLNEGTRELLVQQITVHPLQQADEHKGEGLVRTDAKEGGERAFPEAGEAFRRSHATCAVDNARVARRGGGRSYHRRWPCGGNEGCLRPGLCDQRHGSPPATCSQGHRPCHLGTSRLGKETGAYQVELPSTREAEHDTGGR